MAAGSVASAQSASETSVRIANVAVPFAHGAEVVRTDTPSVFVWDQYQVGRVGRWRYRFSPDAHALFSTDRQGAVSFEVTCLADRASCTVKASDGATTIVQPGAPERAKGAGPDRDTGHALARSYAQWILSRQPLATGAVPLRQGRPAEAAIAPAGPRVATRVPVPRAGDAKRDAFDVAFGGARGAPPPSDTSRPAETGKRYSCDASTSLTPRYVEDGTDAVRYGKWSASLSCVAQPLASLTVGGSLTVFPIASQQQPWDGDFSYFVSYRPLPPLALGYANYTGNRFPWNHREGTGSFLMGEFTASYDFPARNWAPGRAVQCNVGTGLIPQYAQDGTDERGDNKVRLSAGCTVTVFEGFTLMGRVNLFPVEGQQQPWDGDFVYSASYRFNPRLMLEYSNYSGNRFPWNRPATNGGTLADGTIRLVYSIDPGT